MSAFSNYYFDNISINVFCQGDDIYVPATSSRPRNNVKALNDGLLVFGPPDMNSDVNYVYGDVESPVSPLYDYGHITDEFVRAIYCCWCSFNENVEIGRAHV